MTTKQHLPQPAVPSEAQEIERLNKSLRMMAACIHNITVGNQAAWIAWRNEGSAEEGMRWIENGLIGPGLLPGDDDEDGDVGSAQAFYDANIDLGYLQTQLTKPKQAARIELLESVLARLLASCPNTAAHSDDDLRHAAVDENADTIIREQAASLLEARTAIRGTQVQLPLA
jgi:hypothetical protein